MFQNVMIGTRSTKKTKALSLGNSVATAFQSFDVLPLNPASAGYNGVFSAGHDGTVTANRVKIVPYAEGPAGSNFSLRLYGWDVLESPDPGGRLVWVPQMLAEFACTTCNRSGPVNTSPVVSNYFLLDSERLCDTMTLTQGGLGWMGEVVSTGPGTDLIAFAVVDIRGCRFYSYDFAQIDNVGMNALTGTA